MKAKFFGSVLASVLGALLLRFLFRKQVLESAVVSYDDELLYKQWDETPADRLTHVRKWLQGMVSTPIG